MQLKDRIKQAASIDVDGSIVFGAALADHEAVVLEVEMSDTFQYLLEDDSGGFELGTYQQYWDTDTLTMSHSRWATSSNVGAGAGFANESAGLTLSVVQTAGMSAAHSSSDSVGPRTAGVESLAIGPRTEALHSYSTAIGAIARTMFSGESAIGFSQACYPSWVAVGGGLHEAATTAPLWCGETELVFLAGQIYDKGVLRITGTLTATDADTESAAATQVYDVSMILTDIGGAMVALGTPTFTALVAGSGVSGLALAYSAGQINVVNTGANNYIVNGLLHLHWITANDWW